MLKMKSLVIFENLVSRGVDYAAYSVIFSLKINRTANLFHNVRAC